MTRLDHPLYVAARAVLLDALEALEAQREAVIVVGAQAIYLQTGDADLAVAPYTTDADLALEPRHVQDWPHIEDLMQAAHFTQQGIQPGAWVKAVVVGHQPVDVPVDIMIPEALAPSAARRSARLGPHDKMAIRKARGLEGVVFDNDRMQVPSLDDTDPRVFAIRVAGPAALVIAKLYKLHDRLEAGRADRIADKDAADIYRIMQAVRGDVFLARLKPLFADAHAGLSAREAVGFLGQLFGARARRGVSMAADALRLAVPSERVETICTSFARMVRDEVETW